MAEITIGSPAIDRPIQQLSSSSTRLTKNGLANGTGKINYFAVYVGATGSIFGLKMGTFQDNGSENYTSRDYATLGDVSPGFQSFSGLDVDVVTNDLLGFYMSSGYPVYTSDAGANSYSFLTGDQFGTTNTYSASSSTRYYSVYGSGATSKKWNGITISKWNGIVASKINNI